MDSVIATIGNSPSIGNVIPDDYMVRKLRVPIRDMQRGKSGGFRLLYKLVQKSESDYVAYLLFVYVKSQQANISAADLESFIEDIPPATD